MRNWLTAVLLLAALPHAAAGQTEGYWLVREVTGVWQYREGEEEPRPLTGQYEPVAPIGQVRCREQVLSRCELRYLVNSRSTATQRLDVKLTQTDQWVSLKGLKLPPAVPTPDTPNEVVTKFKRTTRAGGSRATSACGGDFPLKAPRCGENIDPITFAIRWPLVNAPTIAIMVERVDATSRPEAQRTMFRVNAKGAEGVFSDPTLSTFLRGIQDPVEPVDITVRVTDGARTAVRLVRIPPTVRTLAYTSRVRTVGLRSDLSRTATLMLLAMEEGMWSRAAEEAAKLARLAGSSGAALEFATIGLCQSDFADERAQLMKRMPARRYDELCAPTAPALAENAGASSAAPAVELPPTGGGPRNRVGIALLIGNSDYWNVPLSSVKNDISNMGETLKSMGFAVTTKTNLRTPRHFMDALDEVLKRENATPEDVLFVYYSGHGFQLDGKPHLLATGVSANAPVAEDLRDNAQSAEDLLAQMERSIPGSRILVIEACRNDLLSVRASARSGGFAFQQDDVPNTVVMFANKPGLQAAARSDYGHMGPFTEALVDALRHSTGTILDVYNKAAATAIKISPSQEPVLYHSKVVSPLTLAHGTPGALDRRAKELLNSAERSYRARAWDEFVDTVTRAKALATDAKLIERLSNEVAFASLVVRAQTLEREQRWSDAADQWQQAHTLFVRREWVAMNAAVAALLADIPAHAVRSLARLGAQSETDLAKQARQMLAALLTAFPVLKSDVQQLATEAVNLPAGTEFETLPVDGVER